MLTVSSLIEFLINLLRDRDVQAEFERDPHGMLARHGLDSLSAQDVHDVLPMVADHACVQVKQAGYHPPAHHMAHYGDDPVRAISEITQHYEVRNVLVNDSHDYNLTYVDDRTYMDDHSTKTYVDDRDTTSIHAGGDVNVTDSFNQDNDTTVVKDSFNQDNDGVDNKGGTIDHSPVAGHDIDHSLNSSNATTVSNSGNTDNSHTNVDASDDHSTAINVQDSYHQDNAVIHVHEEQPVYEETPGHEEPPVLEEHPAGLAVEHVG
jgi:hypothetical protein